MPQVVPWPSKRNVWYRYFGFDYHVCWHQLVDDESPIPIHSGDGSRFSSKGGTLLLLVGDSTYANAALGGAEGYLTMMVSAPFGGAIKDGGGSVTLVAGDASPGVGGGIRLLSGHNLQGSSGSVDVATADAYSSGVSGSFNILSHHVASRCRPFCCRRNPQQTLPYAAGGGISPFVGTGDSPMMVAIWPLWLA